MDDDDIYAIREKTVLHTEQIANLRYELKTQANHIRSLELKWYGVVAGLVGTVFMLAKMAGWV